MCVCVCVCVLYIKKKMSLTKKEREDHSYFITKILGLPSSLLIVSRYWRQVAVQLLFL